MTDGSELNIDSELKEFKEVHNMLVITTETKTYMFNLTIIKYIEHDNIKTKKETN